MTTPQTIADVGLVIYCAGIKPNTDFISKDKLDAGGFIVVDNTLQVPSLTSAACPVFAVGDTTHCGYGRFIVAEKMAKSVVKNIVNLTTNTPPKNVYNLQYIQEALPSGDYFLGPHTRLC